MRETGRGGCESAKREIDTSVLEDTSVLGDVSRISMKKIHYR